MSKKILFLFFCVFALAAHSQNVVIKGSVTDVNKEPLLGVNIKVKGTSTGTITDIDGNFSINGPKGATLVISYIGMVTQEVEYKGQPLNVVLKDDSQALEEVVVVGYGSMRKKDLTGSVVQVRPDKIANDNPKTVQDVLRGTPGLTVGYGESDAGAKVELKNQHEFFKFLKIDNHLIIFSSYYEQPEKLTMDWRLTLNFKINYFMQTSIYANAVYNQNDSKKIQLKQTLNLGVYFRF